MDYRLLYDAGNGYEDLDLGEETPAMSYHIGNLNELKNRHAAYSQAIKLPKTAHNLRVLGFLDSFAVVADAAYTPGRCKLLCEGARISPVGTVLYVDSIDENADGYIECQIVSSAVDLFSILGDVDNEQMGSDMWNGMWTSAQILSDNADKEGAKRWPAVFTQQGQSSRNPFPFGQVEVYHLVPCYRFTTMIEQLFSMYGYRVESDIFDDPYMKSLYITASKITEDSNVTALYSGKIAAVPYPGPSSPYISSSVELESVSQVETLGYSVKVDNENPAFPDWNQWRYYAAQPGDYKLQINVLNRGPRNLDSLHRLRIRVSVTRGVTFNNPGTTETILEEYSINYGTVMPGTNWSVEVEVPGLNTRDYIGFEILIYSGGSTSGDVSDYTRISVGAGVRLLHEDAKPGIGSEFDFARATGFKSYKELVQTFMQLFGLLVDVVPAPTISDDGTVGTVRMYTFQELYRRRDAGQYMDWSHKLVINNERNVGFSLAKYAQTNIIQLTDNKDDGTHDAGSFSVNNRTLESERTLFTIAAEAGRDIIDMTTVYLPGQTEPITSRPLAVVPTLEPTFETNEDTGRTVGVTLNYKGCNAHLIRIDETSVERLQISTGFYTGTRPRHSFPRAVTVPMQELVDRYYAPVKRLVSHARTISAYFNLSALDIEQLDLFTPVWIKRYGCFFYISKVSNFIAGQPTKVELVKMTSYEEPKKYYITLNGSDKDVATTAPANDTTIRVKCRTNGTLQIAHSGNAIADVTFKNGYIMIQTATNETYFPIVSTISLSVEEDPTVVRKITVTQEGMESPTGLAIRLRTDGTNLYIATSRPLKGDERVVIMTCGSGRMAWYSKYPYRTRDYFRSKKIWHIPAGSFKVADDGKITIPKVAGNNIQGSANDYRWRLYTDYKGRTYVHIQKANRSTGFGYRVVGNMDKAVTFAVAVVGQGWHPIELSNRCYFESRCHIRSGRLTQEFVVK